MKPLLVCISVICALGTWVAGALADIETPSVPAPLGFIPCSSVDPVASIESSVAAKLGGEFVGCFNPKRETVAQSIRLPPQREYAFAIALNKNEYNISDLDNLIKKTRDQWRDFHPLDGELSASYILSLNDMIKSKNDSSSAEVTSIRPVLVSIDRPNPNYYTVTSVRTYLFGSQDHPIRSTKVNSDAVVLGGAHFIRLTIQRELSDPADVAQVQSKIAQWARALVSSQPPSAKQ